MTPPRYTELLSRHQWTVPQYYNVATDVCDKHDPDKLAMIWVTENHTDKFIRWGEIQSRSNQFANHLKELGVDRGDRVAVLLPPGVDAAAAVLGILKIGAIGAPMAALWSDESIRYRLEDADAAALITDATIGGRPLCPPTTRLVTTDDNADLDRQHTAFDTVGTHSDEPALIYYTSGSTGRPKGVVSPHRGLLGHNEFEYCQDLREGEISYWMGDWGWGIYKVLGPWRLGAINLVHQTSTRYDPEGLLAALSRHKVTNVFLNPTGLRLMMQLVPDAGIRFPQEFRVCCSANEPLGTAEGRWFEEQFGIPILENYGMTEAYPMVGNFPGVPIKPGSMGLPVPGWDVQILDDEDQPVPVNEPGEISLRARSNPAYPLGYWGRPEATAETFGGEWFHTKDIAHRDEDGYFFYLGRRDDLIKSSGYRISPFEVEEACTAHPAVRAAAVVGIPDPVRGHVVAAQVVLEPGHSPSDGLADEIQRRVRKQHSAFAYPRIIKFVETLPGSQSGKVNRAAVREAFLTENTSNSHVAGVAT